MALAYFWGSRDVQPGSGAQEVLDGDGSQWLELSTIPNWRRMLSNFYPAPVSIWGYVFPTAEHAFQAAKFRDWADAMPLFALGPNGEPPRIGSRGPDARAKRKMHFLSHAQIAAWDRTSAAVMDEIRRAKFAQNAECRRVLLLTGSAHLIHIRVRQDAIRDFDLERLRCSIQDGI